MAANGRQNTGVFTGIVSVAGLAVYVLVVALVEEMGLPQPVTFWVLTAGALFAAAAFGLSAPTMRIPEYFAGGRETGAFHAGLLSVAGVAFMAFFGVTGLDFAAGRDGTVLILGPMAGLVIAGLAAAPQIRRSEAVTVPDYLAARLGGPIVRPVALVVLAAIACPLLAASVIAFGRLASHFGFIGYGQAVWLAFLAILASTLLGGMGSLRRAQLLQFLVLFVAYLLPALLLALREYGVPAPSFLVGQTLHALGRESASPAVLEPETARASGDSLRYLAMVVWIALGTAALPHVLASAVVLREARLLARPAAAWAAVVAVLLFLVAPGYALFVGATDLGFLALPAITGMPFFMSAFLVAGGLAALTAVGAGIALAFANSLTHDLYHHMLDPRAPQGRRLVVARAFLVLISAGAAWFAIASSAEPMFLASVAFSFAIAGFFPVLIASAQWSRLTAIGGAAGMAVGLLAAIAYLIAFRRYGTDLTGQFALASWADPAMIAGFFGLIPGAVVLVGVSVFTERTRRTAPEPIVMVGDRNPPPLVEPPAGPVPVAESPRPEVAPPLFRIRQTSIRSRLLRR
jgi:cation/acetate symporter